MNKRLAYALIFIAVVAALILRLPRLCNRPMHTDEAVHGIKFGRLLEEGVYEYDKNEYHGPTLNYFTLIPAWFSSAKTISAVDETVLRIVPVFFGICLVIFPLFLMNGLGLRSACIAAILTAVSPAMVFYSRYYIQEILLVCFTAGVIVCCFRYLQNKQVWWLIFAGIFAGLMHATKETCLIAYGAMTLAVVLTVLWDRSPGERFHLQGVKVWHLVVSVIAAAGVSALFFSSFLSNPQGVIDSVMTYSTYFNRAGNNTHHIHPWFYYFRWLAFWKTQAGPVWTEAAIVALAVVGFVRAMIKQKGPGTSAQLVHFIAFYTLIMTVIYCAIPYKTPWCLLGFLHGMILLAGFGAGQLLKMAQGTGRGVVVALLCIVVAHLGFQAYRSTHKYAASWRNPWVYSHTTDDIYGVVDRIKQAMTASGDGNGTAARVICSENDYWPLPWYLRSYVGRVGYHSRIDEKMSVVPIVIIAADRSEGLIDKIDREVVQYLYDTPPAGKKNLYIPLFDEYKELRPRIEIRGYVTKNIYDNMDVTNN